MVGDKVKNFNWVSIKVPREAWKRAKIQATQDDKRLSVWVTEAINEKGEMEKGGKK